MIDLALRRIARIEYDESLRKISRPVEKIDKRILVLLEDMLDTMYDAKGVGIAAPQVGVLRRVAIVDIGEGPIEFINPEILDQSGEQTEIEGCLSVPGFTCRVIRPDFVKVKALNRNGDSFELEGTGLLARAICHEIDHLNGILIIDKIDADELVSTDFEEN